MAIWTNRQFHPDHPLVFETLRDCLTEALDLAGLRRVFEGIERGEIQLFAKDTPLPSVFAHQILNSMPYAFLDDAPLEERRARAVFLRRVLPEDATALGKLDGEAIRRAAEDAWPPVRDVEELHDLLLRLIVFPEAQITSLPPDAARWLALLEHDGRARRVSWGGNRYWSAAERAQGRTDRKELWVRQYLRRYGVLLRELLTRESTAPPWRDLLPLLRRMEAQGEIRGGRFVAGCAGEQFAIPEAVDALRAARRREPTGRFVRISACDPLNLVGILTPGSRVPALLGNRVVYRDGVPVAAVEAGKNRLLSPVAAAERPILERMLDPRPASAFDAAKFRSSRKCSFIPNP